MSSLDADFEQLVARLKGPQPRGADPFYYLVYRPDKALDVKARLPVWSARLRNEGLAAERVSFADLLWALVDASGHWPLWLDLEEGAERAEVNEAVRSVLRSGDALIERITAIVEEPRPATVIFLTDTELLHPYFRVRTLESALHDRVRMPTVVCYPGRRVGQFGLRFLDFYPEDHNYRATLIGGLP